MINKPKHRWRSLRAIGALVLREMSTRYGSSPGGYLWALFEPIGGIFLLAIGFSLIFHTPPLGQNFVLFYATGFLPFSIYQAIGFSVERALHFSRPLLFYPTISWIDPIIARFLLNTLTQFFVAILIFIGIFLFAPKEAFPDIQTVAFSFTLSAALGFGIGTLNCYLILRFKVWEFIWAIFNRPLFFICGVFYLYEDVPKFAQDLLYYNPLIHISALSRTGFYPQYHPEFISLSLIAFWILIPLCLGLILLRKDHALLMERL